MRPKFRFQAVNGSIVRSPSHRMDTLAADSRRATVAPKLGRSIRRREGLATSVSQVPWDATVAAARQASNPGR